MMLYPSSFRGDAQHRARNLEIPRCAIAHLRSGPSDHPGITEEKHGPELHRRHGLDLLAAGAEVIKLLAGEAERAGEQRGRHLLDAGVVFLDRVVEEAAAGCDLVLEV